MRFLPQTFWDAERHEAPPTEREMCRLPLSRCLVPYALASLPQPRFRLWIPLPAQSLFFLRVFVAISTAFISPFAYVHPDRIMT